MTAPRVTVITPTRGRAVSTLERCIRCVDWQTRDFWHHVIISDGPAEGHAESAARGNPRRSYMWTGEHTGHFGAGARDWCMRHSAELAAAGALGDCLVFLDDDNIIFPHYLEKMVGALDANSWAEFAVCNIIHTGPLPAWMGDPPRVITGNPVALQHIDTLNVVVRTGVMLETGWLLRGYMSDGHTFASLGERHAHVRVEEILGVHL